MAAAPIFAGLMNTNRNGPSLERRQRHSRFPLRLRRWAVSTAIDIVDEMKASYLDYAMSVIVSRALPDVRDGLKPVHRRIFVDLSGKRLCRGQGLSQIGAHRRGYDG